jgi:hypothetical protein
MRGSISGPDDEHDEDFPEPARLRVLRLSVTAMMAVMALGVLVIAGTIAWRLGGAAVPAPAPVALSAPDIALPEGFAVSAIGADGPLLLVLGRDAAGAEMLLSVRKSDGVETARTPVRRVP